MPPVSDVFGVGVLVIALGALGLSVVFEAMRLSTVSSKAAIVQRRIQSRERELFDVRRRLETAEAEVQAKRVALENLNTEKTRIAAVIASIQTSKIEMVHEIGEADSGSILFQGELRMSTEGGRSDIRRVVFAREIWDRSNVAHVWADSHEAAMAAIHRAFSARTGIMATRVMRADLARAVEPASMLASEAAPAVPTLRAPATATASTRAA